jgi:molybdenum cofactor cytidylyltransferase
VNRSCVVLILAAGRGERYLAAGGQTHKLDAMLTTHAGTLRVLQHVIAAARASGLPWHVVRPQDTAHMPVQGLGTSIATGVRATPDAIGWLVLPADLPLIQPQSIQAIARALEQHAVVVPVVQGQTGHPVGFQRLCKDELLALQGDEGARRICQRHHAHRVVLDDAGCVLDVDTPDALEHVQSLANQSR